ASLAQRVLGRLARLRGDAFLRRGELHAGAACFREADGDRLFRRACAMFSVADVFDLFMNEFARLRRRRFSLPLVAARRCESRFVRHEVLLRARLAVSPLTKLQVSSPENPRMSFRRSILVLSLLLALPLLAATEGGTPPVPLPVFPQNNWWNTDITNAPAVLDSTIYYGKMGGSTRALHPDFGGDSIADDKLPADVYGFPFILVAGSQPKLTVTFDQSPDESDGVNHNTETSIPFYPVPTEAITNTGWIESGQAGNVDDRSRSDRHMLMIDTDNNTL